MTSRCLALTAIFHAILCTTTQCSEKSPTITLEDAKLPITAFYNLKKGDKVAYILPSGRRISWQAEVNGGFAEQSTNSGLKAHSKEPELNDMKEFSVSTSGQEEVSIYSFEIDVYRVERAEDLKASYSLPILIRVSKVGTTNELDHAIVRERFTKEVSSNTGAPPRVPIETVHKGLLENFSFPIRLVIIDNQLRLDISGELSETVKDKRESELVKVMQYVTAHWDRAEKTDRFTIAVLAEDRTAFLYVATKDSSGTWHLSLKK